jgi:ubiquinone/menaquinone biosynthesis C-methylase UbiE
MNTTAPRIFDRMSALADATRSRLLLLLEEHELAVGELCVVLQLPQSTVSRHLKVLGDEGWLVSRAEGPSRLYRMAAAQLDETARRLWALVRGEVGATAAALHDAERLRSVLAQRRSTSKAFFSTAAGEWDRLREELFGRRADLLALLALLEPDWTVADLGCGTGSVSEAMAPFVGRIVAVDDSDAMLDAARARLAGQANVELRPGALEALPLEDGSVDAAIVFLVLHHVVEPARALGEAARVLRPNGRLLIADMTPHDRIEFRHEMGHVWQGFSADELAGWIEEAGLGDFRYVRLPPDPAAKGPGLFSARARKTL